MPSRSQVLVDTVFAACLVALAACERLQQPIEPEPEPTQEHRLQGTTGRITVTPARTVLDVNERVQLTAVVTDADGQPVPDALVTWTSASPRVATVDERGVVTGVAPGGVTLKATSQVAEVYVSIWVVYRTLAFTNETQAYTDYAGPRNIYTISGTGTNLKQLTSVSYAQRPLWSPLGDRILFTSWTSISSSWSHQVFVMNADGSGQTKLSSTPAGTSAHAWDWSPDGAGILFRHDWSLRTMTVYGTNQAQLTAGSSDRDTESDWSPDGKKIVFVRHQNGSGKDVYVMNADGSGQTKLAITPEEDEDPRYSPNGAKVAFTRVSNEGQPAGVYVVNSDGTGLTVVTPPGELALFFDWSPDGSRILYGSYGPEGSSGGERSLMVVDLNGAGATKIASGQVLGADWSADGEKIAFTRCELYSGCDLRVVRPNGTAETLILSGPSVSDPRWRP